MDKLTPYIFQMFGFVLAGVVAYYSQQAGVFSQFAELNKNVALIQQDVAYLKKDTTDKTIAFQNWRDKVDQTLSDWGARTYHEPEGAYTKRGWKK